MAASLAQVSARPDTAAIRAWLAAAPSAETARSRLRAVRAIYRGAGYDAGAPWDVRLPRSRPRPPRSFTAAEIAAILEAAPPNTRAAIVVALETGARVGELAALTPADVDPAPHGARGFAALLTLRGKDGPRRVPASSRALRALQATGAAPGAPYFPGGARALQSRIRYAIARAGITPPRAGPHTLRATFASRWLASGGDIWHLSRMLGHASIAQTQAYLALADSDLWDAYAAVTAPAANPATPHRAALLAEP